jgi:uncharacterized protein YjbI with pentapeptide repeats/energy-coupling factor transporter ATP-binding protein EcfA2
LSAFQEKDREVFFGREKVVEDLVKAIKNNSLVSVIGSSGAGKSSVVNAGVIPRLRDETNWLVDSFRPGKDPIYSFASSLARLRYSTNAEDYGCYASKLNKQFTEDLRDVSHEVGDLLFKYKSHYVMLFIDQFEELYNLNIDKNIQCQFIDSLLKALDNNSRLRVILTIRHEFLDEITNYPLFNEMVLGRNSHHHLLPITDSKALESVIELPDKYTKRPLVQLEEGLKEVILDDIQDEPGKLPLLEFALTTLWKKSNGGVLTLRSYKDVGGVRKALIKHADKIYDSLTFDEQKKMREIFLMLIRPGEIVSIIKMVTIESAESSDDMKSLPISLDQRQSQPTGFNVKDQRQSVGRSEIGEENWPLVTKLSKLEQDDLNMVNYLPLLVTSRNEKTGEQTVELIHEALIREWDLLANWLNSCRGALSKFYEIDYLAKKWDEGDRKSGYLQGKFLADAKEFRKQAPIFLPKVFLSDRILEFIRASDRDHRKRYVLVPVALVGTVGIVGLFFFLKYRADQVQYRAAKVQQLWSTVDSAQRQRDATGRNKALENLVVMGESLKGRNFHEYDLTKINLKGADLAGANFHGAILKGANLSNADLRSAIFTEADLSEANLDNVKLAQADFTDAYAANANFQNSDLTAAIFMGTDLGKAKLSNSQLGYTNFSAANLRNTMIINADFSDSDLSDSDLANSNLEGSNLANTNFQGAYVDNTKFNNTNVSGANFKDAINFANKQIKMFRKGENAATIISQPDPARQGWFSLQVSSQVGWQNTKICIQKDETLHIVAQGKWANGFYKRSDGVFYSPFNNAKGRETTDSKAIRENWISPKSNVSALIGRFSNGNREPFEVGLSYVKKIDRYGCLQLTINDNIINDNTGEMSVRVRLDRK